MEDDRSSRTYEQIMENLRAAEQRQRDAWAEELRVLAEFDEREGALSEAELRGYRLRFGIEVAGPNVASAAARRARREELEGRLSRS